MALQHVAGGPGAPLPGLIGSFTSGGLLSLSMSAEQHANKPCNWVQPELLSLFGASCAPFQVPDRTWHPPGLHAGSKLLASSMRARTPLPSVQHDFITP